MTTGVSDPAQGLSAAVFDPQRLAAVAASELLDSEPEDTFDDLAGLAAAITGAQMAFFTVADGRRSYWKSAVGIDVTTGRENDIRDSPCHILIGTGQELIAEDAVNDPRIAHLAAVDELAIGAWAGYPVTSPDGHVLGGLCVIDKNPRSFTAEQSRALRTLARTVSAEIALRQALRQAQEAGKASAALARTLQDSLLLPRLPHTPGLDVAAVHLPAGTNTGEVVGDFYDLFRARGQSWCVVMGDVCGKGIEAAKVTALARYTVRAEATQHSRPATVLHRLHEAIVDQQVSDRFLTVALAVLRPVQNGIAGWYADAGHPPALIRRADGTVQELNAPGGMLSPLLTPVPGRLGETSFHLYRGDAILLYTDGIIEARNGKGPLFGEDRLATELAATRGRSAADTLNHLQTQMLAHSGPAPVDDTALMLVQVSTPTA